MKTKSERVCVRCKELGVLRFGQYQDIWHTNNYMCELHLRHQMEEVRVLQELKEQRTMPRFVDIEGPASVELQKLIDGVAMHHNGSFSEKLELILNHLN